MFIQKTDNSPSIWRDIAIAAVPAVLAIVTQKAVDEMSSYFQRKRVAAKKGKNESASK